MDTCTLQNTDWGPGTLPKGITVLREEELDNYLTVFLDG